MHQPLLESDVTIVGTLDESGNFQWEQDAQSASPEVREIVAQLRKCYRPQEREALRTNQDRDYRMG